MADVALLSRRLANFRGKPGTRIGPNQVPAIPASGRHVTTGNRSVSNLAQRLAAAMDGELLIGPNGTVVRVEAPARTVPLDRDTLARLPGQPPAHVPLVCLDTETTGLATAAGTVAFLVGLGWWEGTRFRQVQLLLPDHSDEPALLAALAACIPADAWLVTYNGRGFDWPLLVARYRMAGRAAPDHAGHLDLLSTVRQVFRHRMVDARLRTVEEMLLGVERVDDVGGWEIPGRYLAFLRGGSAHPLIPVVEHNDRDVLSLARLLVHLADELGDEDRRRHAPDGDLLGLARAYRRAGRPYDALACLDLALDRGKQADVETAASAPRIRPTVWPASSPGTRAPAIGERGAESAYLVRDQLACDRARLLRRTGQRDAARRAWQELATRNGPLAAMAWVEVAKLLEHVERDFDGGLDAVAAAERLVDRTVAIGHPGPILARDLAHRHARLSRRWAARQGAGTPPSDGTGGLRQPPAHAGADG